MSARAFRKNLTSGFVTLIPLGVTWFLLDFIFTKLSNIGRPLVAAVSADIRDDAPEVSLFIRQPWFDDVIAVIIVIFGIYCLGWFTNRVIGKRLFSAFEWLLGRLPIVKSIYSSVKKITDTFQSKPESTERVVLISFPNDGMKAVGLVSRTFKDAKSGRMLAAVYVPTTPNPTSGFLEVVPVDDLVSTDWTIDQAMAFIISGGSNAPDELMSFS